MEINFPTGLNVITGETGAGKSILMGALNLILGGRAAGGAIRDPKEKCIVEAIFHMPEKAEIKQFLTENDFDFAEEILLRREIAPNGKSRVFINDSPANNSQLRTISQWLVDLHQQFDTLEITNENFQREVVDALAGNESDLHQLKAEFSVYKKLKTQLDDALRLQAEANKEQDYNRFLFDELAEANFTESELENLEVELRTLSHAEEIKSQLTSFNFLLNEAEEPIIQQLKSISNKLNSLENNLPAAKQLTERLNSTILELKDIAAEIDDLQNNTNLDAERMEIISSRLDIGYKLLKKHGVNETNQLLRLKEELETKLDGIINLGNTISELEKKSVLALTKCNTIAGKISANRKKQAPVLEAKVNSLLTQIGMPNARLKVQIDSASLSQFGADNISFLFNANVPANAKYDVKYDAVEKVASGGELSRLMLCIKSLVATRLSLPTLIFDEIDTGISGEAAKQVAAIMQGLAGEHQLIVISHQPQIAAKANQHFYVYKEQKSGQVKTGIRSLSNSERINNIAVMLSGDNPGQAAINTARELIG